MKRRLWTSGEIYRLFQKADESTIMRKPNIRRFAKEKDIFHEERSSWLIDVDEFLKYIYPHKIPEQKKIPIIRTLKACRLMFNEKYALKLTKHDTENLVPNRNFFCYKYGNKWLINYEEFERYLIDCFHVNEDKKQ